MRRVAETVGSAESTVFEWSGKNRWVERVAAWDAHNDRLLIREQEEARKAFAERLAATGALMQMKGISRIRAVIDRFDRDGQMNEARPGQEFADELSVADATRLIEAGARLESMGRGGTPESVEQPIETPKVTIVQNPVLQALMVNPNQTAEVVEQMENLVKLLEGPDGGD